MSRFQEIADIQAAIRVNQLCRIAACNANTSLIEPLEKVAKLLRAALEDTQLREDDENQSPLWVEDLEKTREHWLELRDPDGWWKAYVKWDGCLQIDHAGNVAFKEGETERPEEACDDGMHICDLDAFIERLIVLRNEARMFFGEEWE